MIYISVIISLVTCSIAIMSDYKVGEPKRFQMLLYWLKKPIVDFRERIEHISTEKKKDAREYYSNAINSLQENDVRNSKVKYYMDLQDKKLEEIESWKERKLNYEFYLKPIILCVLYAFILGFYYLGKLKRIYQSNRMDFILRDECIYKCFYLGLIY